MGNGNRVDDALHEKIAKLGSWVPSFATYELTPVTLDNIVRED
jgi:hypothetical protein